MTAALYSVYLLSCDNRCFYAGIAVDPLQRLQQHRSGKPPGAKFTRGFKQLELVFQVIVGNRSEAQTIEHFLKKLPKKSKQVIINQQPTLTELKTLLFT